MTYNENSNMVMLRGIFRAFISIIASVLFLTLPLPEMAYAQSYVPVIDIQLNPFMQSALGAAAPNGTTDSLRDLIAGSNPGGLAATECATGNNLEGQDYPAFAYGQGSVNPANWEPWMYAHNAPGNTLPDAVPAGAGPGHGPYVQINYSHSLRCLLMEQVEWQKLSLSVQIHSLLKTYISDAQQAQLTKQLRNRVTAANLQFAKAGNQVSNAGVQSNAPVFVTNYNQNLRNVNGRQLEAISDQAAADPASGNPQGSLGICQPWRIDTAATIVKNNRSKVEDPFNYTEEVTGCSLTANGADQVFANEGDYFNYGGNGNFNDASNVQGGLFTFHNLLNNPKNSPLGAITVTDNRAQDRIRRQEESTKAEAANSGFLPTKVCSGDASDPHCLDDQNSVAVNPGAQNEANITNLTSRMNDEMTSDAIDSQTATSSQRTPTDINTNTGLVGADTLPLETSGTAINQLVQEFYDAIRIGYFGVNGNTTQWAQATMLSIYDEMKFSQDISDLTNPNGGASVVTNGQVAVPTNY